MAESSHTVTLENQRTRQVISKRDSARKKVGQTAPDPKIKEETVTHWNEKQQH